MLRSMISRGLRPRFSAQRPFKRSIISRRVYSSTSTDGGVGRTEATRLANEYQSVCKENSSFPREFVSTLTVKDRSALLSEALKIEGEDGDEGQIEDEVRLRFKEIDVNKDGHVSEEEFGAWWLTSQGSRIVADHKDTSDVDVRPPKPSQLLFVSLRSGIPFVAFGFLDNAIMIIAGDLIEDKLAASLCIGTMACAALGNTISDVAGQSLGGLVESQFARLGLPDPHLSVSQAAMKITKWVNFFSQVFGIIIGCIIGMLPLLWIDDFEKTAKKIFVLMDSDSDGYVRRHDLDVAIKLLGLPKEVSNTLVQGLFDKMDYEHDHKVSQDEFVHFARELAKHPEMLKQSLAGDVN